MPAQWDGDCSPGRYRLLYGSKRASSNAAGNGVDQIGQR